MSKTVTLEQVGFASMWLPLALLFTPFWVPCDQVAVEDSKADESMCVTRTRAHTFKQVSGVSLGSMNSRTNGIIFLCYKRLTSEDQ